MAVFVSTLLVSVGLSLFAVDSPMAGGGGLAFASALHIETTGDRYGSQTVTVNHDPSGHNDSDTDDDDDSDGDDAPALVTIVFASDLQVDRAAGWLTLDTTVRPEISHPSDNHSLRAPPQ